MNGNTPAAPGPDAIRPTEPGRHADDRGFRPAGTGLLDAQTRAFLDIAHGRLNAPGDIKLDEYRREVEPFQEFGFEREEVSSVADLEVPSATRSSPQRVRLYRPRADGLSPVVLWVHGGSWVRLTLEFLDNYYRFLANRSGCAIAAVDYWLAPEARFPEQLEDIHAAAAWLKVNAAALGLDATRIGIAGESAGANMAAAVTLLDRDRGSVLFAHQALLVPLLDATFSTPSWRELGTGYALTRGPLEWALEQYAPGVERSEPLLSPVHASTLKGLPPALIVTGEFDPLRDDGEAYADRLRADGVAVRYECRRGLIHQAILAPKLMDTGRHMVEFTAAALKDALCNDR